MKNLGIMLITYLFLSLTTNAQVKIAAYQGEALPFQTWFNIKKDNMLLAHQRILSDTLVLDSVVSFTWDSTANNWVNWERIIYSYDANANIAEYVFSAWNTTTQVWDNYYNIYNTYNANGKLIQDLWLNWDAGTNTWVNSGKSDYTYDANGNGIEELEYSWTVNGTWIYKEKRTYSYNVNAQVVQELYDEWNVATNSWDKINKDDYTYNVNGDILEHINYYNWSTNNWNNKIRYTYNYNANNLLSTLLSENWNPSTNVWQNGNLHIYEYDANNNLVTDSACWNPAGTWIPGSKDTYLYDANHNNLQHFIYNWEDTNNNWAIEWEIYNTYDTNGNILEVLKYYSSVTYSGISKDVYYYSLHGSSLAVDYNQNGQSVAIYPNPAQNSLHIKNVAKDSKCVIYDINGNLRLSASLLSEKLNISDLPKGIYMIKVQTEDTNSEKIYKFVKE